LRDPPKFTQIGIFGSKRNHLASRFLRVVIRKWEVKKPLVANHVSKIFWGGTVRLRTDKDELFELADRAPACHLGDPSSNLGYAKFLQRLMALLRPTQYSIPYIGVKTGQGDS
jgi:hypothetical protein